MFAQAGWPPSALSDGNGGVPMSCIPGSATLRRVHRHLHAGSLSCNLHRLSIDPSYQLRPQMYQPVVRGILLPSCVIQSALQLIQGGRQHGDLSDRVCSNAPTAAPSCLCFMILHATGLHRIFARDNSARKASPRGFLAKQLELKSSI